MKYIVLIFPALFLALSISANNNLKQSKEACMKIHRYIQIRFHPNGANYRLHIITVVTNKRKKAVHVKIEDNIPSQLKLVRGRNIWEGTIYPEKDSYDAGYCGYELLISPQKGEKYIISPARVLSKIEKNVIIQCTPLDTVIFDREISDFWGQYDFYMNIPVGFHLEKEMRDKHFLTFTGYPFDPRWIFIWWTDTEKTDIDGKMVADFRVKIGMELYDQEEDEVSEILPCNFLNYKAFKVKGNWKNPRFRTEGIFATYGFIDNVQKRLYLIDIITFGYDGSRLNELEKAIRTFQIKNK